MERDGEQGSLAARCAATGWRHGTLQRGPGARCHPARCRPLPVIQHPPSTYLVNRLIGARVPHLRWAVRRYQQQRHAALAGLQRARQGAAAGTALVSLHTATWVGAVPA